MSRILTTDQNLIDRLILNDTDAFEELYRQYWQGLYLYCLKKLQSPGDAKKIVRTIFIQLWQERQSLPVSFSLSRYFYIEVRKLVVKTLSEKLADLNDPVYAGDRFTHEFSVQYLQAASRPISGRDSAVNKPSELVRQFAAQEQPNSHSLAATIKWIIHSFSNKLSLTNLLSYPKN